VGYLAYFVEGLVNPQSGLCPQSMRQQEKVFPQPAEKGAAMKMIISALREICA